MHASRQQLLAQWVGALARGQADAGSTDGQLLTRFVARRDEAAFAALVRRHGPMVLGVCRRALGNEADAEDAFQATFLVLVRRAASLAARPVLGDWLHGVARRTALKARAVAAHRRLKEKATARPEAPPEDGRNDWLPLLDQELARLPEKYRLPLVLCDLEGKTRREAAGQLGWAEGTVAGRLARGRALLAKKLLRGARALPAALTAALPAGLARSTVTAALTAAGEMTGGAVAAGAAGVGARALRPLLWGKGKAAVAALLLSAAVAAGLGALAPERPPAPAVEVGEKAAAPPPAVQGPGPLDGAWRVKDADALGKHSREEVAVGQTWVIAAGKIAIQYGDGDTAEWAFALGPPRSPRPIDLKQTGGRLKGRAALGICERKGEVLHICFNGGDRPTAFDLTKLGHSRSGRLFVLEPVCQPVERPAGAGARLGSARLAHQGNASCAAFSPDGKVLATGGHDQFVRLWDATTGRELHALRHFRWVRAVVWAPDGKTLFSASDGEGVRAWDATTGKERRRLGGKAGMVTSLALTRDGKTLAYCEMERTVVLRDVSTDRELYRFQADERAYRVAFSPDGKVLAVGGDHLIHRRHVATGRALSSLAGHAGGTYAVAFSPDGKFLASGGTHPDGTIVLWSAAEGKEVRRWKASAHAVYALAFAPDSKSLLSGTSSEPLRLWDVATGKEVRAFRDRPYGHVDALAFTPDGKHVASAGCWERGVYLWDVATGREVSPFARHHGEVAAVAFSPDGKLLATGSSDRTVGLWHLPTGSAAGRLRGHPGPVLAVAFASGGELVASSGEGEKVVRLWHRRTGLPARTLTGGRFPFTCLAFSPDGKLLAAGEGVGPLSLPGFAAPDGAVLLWNVATGKEARKLQAKAGRVSAVAFSPDGRLLATAGLDDGAIHLWDVHTGAELARLERSTDPAAPRGMFEGTLALAFSPDGLTLAAISFYEHKSNTVPLAPIRQPELRAVSLWEVATGKMRREVQLPRNRVRSVAFVGPRSLVLGARDGALLTLDLARDAWLPPVRGHRDALAALAVSPDGRSFATGSLDTTALLWRAEPVIGPRPQRKTRATPRQLEALADDLSRADAPRAYRAGWALAAEPGAAEVLARRVRPVPMAGKERMQALIAGLGGDEYQAREEASGELERLADLAAPAVREALRARPSLEVRLRAERLLARLGPTGLAAASTRALEVLEQAGTPEARRLLEALAKGAPAARQTQMAKAALGRLMARP